MKILKYFFLLIPVLCFATTYDNVAAGMDYFNFTDISVEDDLSMTLLGMIFGNFNDMLPAIGYSVLTPVLEHFNQGVFAIAVGMVTYVTFLSTIKTAEEGKPMGEKTPIFWMLLRPIIGTTLLVPSSSGYSYLQSLMMWAIISGVSFANSIWYTVVQTVNNYGGSLSGMESSAANAAKSDFNSSAVLAQYLFESELCLLGATTEYKTQQGEAGATSSSSINTIVPEPSANYDNSNYTLSYNNLPEGYTCGNYQFTENNVITLPQNAGNTSYTSYSVADVKSMLNNSFYNAYMMAKSLASQQYQLINNLTNVDWATNTTICQTTYSTTPPNSMNDLNCNLGMMLANNAMMLKINLDNLIELTAVSNTENTNGINTAGGWMMAAAAYFKLVSSSGGSSSFGYYNFAPGNAFIGNGDVSSQNNSSATQELCYVSTSAANQPIQIPTSNTDHKPCNISIPKQFIVYSNSDNQEINTNWLMYDINSQPGGNATSPGYSNAPKYMSLYNTYYSQNASNAGDPYNSGFDYTNTYQSQICQPKGWITQMGNTYSSMPAAFGWVQQPSNENCETVTSFTTPNSGQVNANSLPAVLSAQIYGAAIPAFGGQDINSSFQNQLLNLSKQTSSGVPITSSPTQNNMPFSNSGVKPYAYNQIPQLPSDGADYASMVLSGVFSSWDVSGSGSKFYDIYNNYLASVLIQWQKSFLNSNVAEPISAVRDFGIQVVSMSIQFIVAMTQKIYITQVLIMVKYIGWFIFFSLIAAGGSLAGFIIHKIAFIVFLALLASFFFAPLAYPLYLGINAITLLPQVFVAAPFQTLANVALMFLQIEIKGTYLWVPLVMSTAVPIMTLAMVLAFYAPMIPFLIWCLACINWMIGVIESMVAAPIVALGITSPQGHDFLGKAELCMMLILAVFIRPAAMVIGFIFAVCIAYFGFYLFNFMMFYTMQIYLSSVIINIGGKAGAVLLGFLLMVYCYTVITFVNQIFSMIYQIPNKIMRWIGVPVDEPDEEQWLEEIKGGTTDAISGLAGASTQAAGQMAQGGMAESGGQSAQGARQNMAAQRKGAEDMKAK